MDVEDLRLIIVLIVSLVTPTSPYLLDGHVLSANLHSFADKVGMSQIQKLYDNAQFVETPVSGQSLVSEISDSLAWKLNGPITAAQNIKRLIEETEQNFTTEPLITRCCDENNTTYSATFRGEVNFARSCVRISSSAVLDSVYPNQAVEDVIKKNARQYPNLKWQFFASEKGLYLTYPSLHASDCSNYDPRYRPFYVETATPTPKDVVIVLDRSGSMVAFYQGRTLLQIAKEAAITVLQTLNPNDGVGVIAFASKAVIVGVSDRSCLASSMALATPRNKKYLTEKINLLHVDVGASTNYEAALIKAFDILGNATDHQREKVILFLTDGRNLEGGDPLVTLAERNQAIGNGAIVFTYALGTEFQDSDKQLLKDMAFQAKTNASYGDIKVGQFQQIKDPSLLRYSMASYYNRFSGDEKLSNPVFSVPYQDLFGIGMVTSVCVPVYKGTGDLLGVACCDVTMADLLADITYFKQGELSYAFIIDGRGRTLMHPQLPQPSSVKDDPFFVHIDHLERSAGAASVIKQMMLGTVGQKRFLSQLTVSRGSRLYEGIETRTINTTYSWGPIRNSNFTMAIVVGEGETLSLLQYPVGVDLDRFHYHRLDIQPPPSACKHYGRFATRDFSTVMLTPVAFLDPIHYLVTPETVANITDYDNFFRGISSSNRWFKKTVLQSVDVTYGADQIWKTHNDVSDLVVWRYIATTDGLVRSYPGIQIPINYDFTRRPWYIRTLALKGKLVFSPPYSDQWGSKSHLISMVRTVTEQGLVPSSIPTSDDVTKPIVGATGADFHMPEFYQVVLRSYDVCKQPEYSCFVVDTSGLVVVHKDFLNSVVPDIQVVHMHLITKEPAIAADLLLNSNMIQTSCLDLENIKEQYTYRITIHKNGLNRMDSDAMYEIHPVTNTNILVVIRKIGQSAPRTPCCTTAGGLPDTQKCQGLICDCLCYTEAYFNYCRNRYPLLGDAAPTCSPQPPALITDTFTETDLVKGLDICFGGHCTDWTTKEDCDAVGACEWCHLDNKNGTLPDPFCGTIYQCPDGMYTQHNHTVIDNIEPVPRRDLPVGSILGITAGCVAIVVLAAGALVWCRRITHTDSSRNQEPELEESGYVHIGYVNDSPSLSETEPKHVVYSALSDNYVGTSASNRY